MDAVSTVHRHALFFSIFGVMLSASTSVRALELMPPGRYDVTIETGMPHLEESLRYSTTRETRCLAHQELSSAFPVLAHPSLQGCRLGDERREGEVVSYALLCKQNSATRGHAAWHLTDNRIAGTLHVKLGGKNMTLYQRVTAVFAGKCRLKTQAPQDRDGSPR
jgi:hypothetical protein